MAGAPQKHGPHWRVRWKCPGVPRRQTHILETFEEARDFSAWVTGLGNQVQDGEDRVRNNTWNPKRAGETEGRTSVRFGQFAEDYLALQALRDDIVPQTLESKRHRLKRATASWVDLPCSAINRALILQTVADMKRHGYAPSTMLMALQTAQEVVTAAHGAGAIQGANPFKADPLNRLPGLDLKRVTGYDKQPRKRMDHELRIPADEWPKLLDAAAALGKRLQSYGHHDPRQLYLQIRMLVECGMRIGELLALGVSDCFFTTKDSYAIIRATRLRDGAAGPTKTRDHREIMVPNALAAELAPLLERRQPGDALFAAPLRGGKGWRYDYWYNGRFAPMVQLAKDEFGFPEYIKIHPHALRMGFITWARNAGVPTRDIQRQVGHKQESTTALYDLGGPESRVKLRSVVDTWTPPPSRRTGPAATT